MTQQAPDQDLDQFAHDLAHQLHAAIPQAQAQLGGGAPKPAPPPEEIAAQLRPHLTAENVAFLTSDAAAGLFGGGGGGGAGGGGAGKKPFNLGNFIKNLGGIYNGVAPLVSVISGLFGKPITLPPITLPVPPPTNPAPAGA